MTDAELNIFSARAIFPEKKVHVGVDEKVWIREYYPFNVNAPGLGGPRTAPWKPLADGHQAMMLVEELRLTVTPAQSIWVVHLSSEQLFEGPQAVHEDLRRAIVICAAMVHQKSASTSK